MFNVVRHDGEMAVRRDASIIIVSRNDASTIRHSIEASLAVEYPQDRFEVIVYDDCSLPAQRDILSQMAEERTAGPCEMAV